MTFFLAFYKITLTCRIHKPFYFSPLFFFLVIPCNWKALSGWEFCNAEVLLFLWGRDKVKGGVAGVLEKVAKGKGKAKQSKAKLSGVVLSKSLLIMAMPPYPPGNRNS